MVSLSLIRFLIPFGRELVHIFGVPVLWLPLRIPPSLALDHLALVACRSQICGSYITVTKKQLLAHYFPGHTIEIADKNAQSFPERRIFAYLESRGPRSRLPI